MQRLTGHHVCFPEWVKVTEHDGYSIIANKLTGSSLRVSGSAGDVLREIRRKLSGAGVCAIDDFAHSKPGVVEFLERLFEHEYVVDADDNMMRWPLFVPTKEPIFGAKSLKALGDTRGTVVFGAPYNFGNRRTSGTCDAPDAIRAMSKDFGIGVSDIFLRNTLGLLGLCPAGIDSHMDLDASCTKSVDLFDAGNILSDINASSRIVSDRIFSATNFIMDRECIPFLLGGDHACTLGTLRAVASRLPEFDVVQLDAHTDTYFRAFDQYLGDAAEPNHGNFMSYVLQELREVRHVHQYGIRGLGNLLQEPVERQVIHNIFETRRLASQICTKKITERPVYLTVDIDVLDPSVLPGTGSPLPNGLSYTELMIMLWNIIMGNNVIGFDLVELDVGRDRDRVSTIICMEVAAFVIFCINRASQTKRL
jgi:agmatinase